MNELILYVRATLQYYSIVINFLYYSAKYFRIIISTSLSITALYPRTDVYGTIIAVLAYRGKRTTLSSVLTFNYTFAGGQVFHGPPLPLLAAIL